jgi:hypothetical protein
VENTSKRVTFLQPISSWERKESHRKRKKERRTKREAH